MELFDRYNAPVKTAHWYFWPHFLTQNEAKNIYKTLESELAWQQGHIKMFGKTLAEPRLTAWYGDAGKTYTYAGKRQEPLDWHPSLWQLKTAIEAIRPYPPSVSPRFNSVLANFYRNGQDSMGWHSDDEPELGPQPLIASLNLGATRRFLWRHKHDKSQKQTLHLNSGSLLLMFGDSQSHWQHAVPKSPKIAEGRINLTFRYII